jgi:hypothetical protein
MSTETLIASLMGAVLLAATVVVTMMNYQINASLAVLAPPKAPVATCFQGRLAGHNSRSVAVVRNPLSTNLDVCEPSNTTGL